MQCFPLMWGRIEVQLDPEAHARGDVADSYEKLEALICTTRVAWVEHRLADARLRMLRRTLRIAVELLRWSNGGFTLPADACALVVDFLQGPVVTIGIPVDLFEVVWIQENVSHFEVVPLAAWRRTVAAFEEAIHRRLRTELNYSASLRIREKEFQVRVETLSTALRRPLWATAHVVDRPFVEVQIVEGLCCISECDSEEEMSILQERDDDEDTIAYDEDTIDWSGAL